ncbi:hypothetical protein KIH86_14240 [Paenibacillus sp. HN-1]|uniref:DUF6323 family protein n=1 Tax=Paenibacillus TaxID=44249 RepID=UPI001CA9EC5F|nr:MULTISPECIES: DUF6323 family protein [Paenibacillus]MBY9080668.1 hypothetical protein [Paenibacillus sp. CGMCC 1.18879]MBY9085387.1 hypothetical protein [Paenibacillus sinensis]
MFLSRLFNSLSNSMQEQAVIQILELNEKTKEYGLVLSPDEARQMIVARNQVLHNYGRVELSIEVTKELIEVFSESPHMREEDYASTLNELHEVFYNLKNETEDKIGDSRLIELMRELYDEDCGGSLDLLKSKLEEYAEVFRREVQMKEAKAMLEGDDKTT